MKKVAVVGGGITGLTAALHLQEAGLHPLVFEAGPAAGGAMQTRLENGYRYELGPNTLQENSAEITKLITSLGLANEVVEAGAGARKRYVLRDGRPVAAPSSPGSLLRSPLLSWRGKIRLLREPFAPPASGEEEPVADFARRRLGQEALDYLVDPFVAGIYAGDPARLSLQHAFPRIHQMETDHGSVLKGLRAAPRGRAGGRSPRLISFREGLGALPARLSERLQKHIYFETKVQSITAREGGWEVVASRYDHRLRDRYDAVVLALPPDPLADLSIGSPGNSTALSLLREIPQPPVVSISVGFRRDQVHHSLDGFGVLIPAREKRNILGVLFPSTLFPGRAPTGHVLLTAFAGGVRQAAMAELEEPALVDEVMKDLRDLLGISGRPEFLRIHRWTRAIPQYEIGHGRCLEAIDRFEADHPGLFVAGASRDGISLGQCIASGYRHGARAAAHAADAPAFTPRRKAGPNR